MERQSFFKARSNVLIFLVISLMQVGVLILGTVKRVMLTGSKVCGVQVDDYELPADAVLIALGPWSNHARSWFPKANLPDIYGMRAHSVVVRMPQAPPQALFLPNEMGEVIIFSCHYIWLICSNFCSLIDVGVPSTRWHSVCLRRGRR